MDVSLFDFELPKECVAARPAFPRDSAKLLNISDTLYDRRVRDLPDILQSGDVLVFNNTRVIPARLQGKRGDATVEITLHKHVEGPCWLAFARPARKLRAGDVVRFSHGVLAIVEQKKDDGEITCRFNCEGNKLSTFLAKHGSLPLPPYIPRDEGADSRDVYDYQTIFASQDGAVAAPTAGLHFTKELMGRLNAKGIQRQFVTLHVGAGTFLPVKVSDTKDHIMHSEYGVMDEATAEALNTARAEGKRLVAVGTTSLRLLESATDTDGRIQPFVGETDIFITPGYAFKAVDMLLTNFHLPKSTLFMLVSAFSGLERMKKAYAHAIAQGYRFYSYGDACLLHRADILDA